MPYIQCKLPLMHCTDKCCTIGFWPSNEKHHWMWHYIIVKPCYNKQAIVGEIICYKRTLLYQTSCTVYLVVNRIIQNLLYQEIRVCYKWVSLYFIRQVYCFVTLHVEAATENISHAGLFKCTWFLVSYQAKLTCFSQENFVNHHKAYTPVSWEVPLQNTDN